MRCLQRINSWAKRYDSMIKFGNLIVLIVTAVLVWMYWGATQEMKREMVKQNRISFLGVRISNMPVIDLQIEKVNSDPTIQFAYDLFAINKGNGPAFNVSIRRIPLPGRTQKEAIHPPPNVEIHPFSKRFPIIGKGEKVGVRREHSTSYKQMEVVVTCRDFFGEFHQWKFEGDRSGLDLKDYPKFAEP